MDMTTSISPQVNTPLSPGKVRAQAVWSVTVQVLALGLTILALLWASPPASSFKALLGLLALCALVVAVVPGWRRGVVAGVLAGIVLALACHLSTGHKLPEIPGIDPLITGYTPTMTLVLAVVSLLMAGWGVVVKVGLADQARFGVAALASLLLISFLSLFYLMIFTFGVKMEGVVESWQLANLLAVTLLYSLAIWFGGTGIRPTVRWTILPFGLVLVLAGFLIYWHTLPH